jgi:tryptophan synthase alpha chain
MELRHQRLIGFGISNKATLDDACSHAAGAIIGSKFIKCLESTDTPAQAVAALLQALS